MQILPFYAGVRSYVRDNIIYFVNSEAGTWAAMPETYAKFLTDETSSKHQEIFDTLRKNKILRSGQSESVKSRRPVKPLLVKLLTTGKCNLQCVYCFNSKFVRDKSMTSEILRQSIDYVFSNPYAQNGISFVIYGGEPLIERELLYEAVRLIRGRETSLDVKLEIITNGTLLTKSDVEFFRENEVGIIISFDGLQSFHDKNRSSSEKVMQSIKMLEDMNYVSHSNILCTVTREMSSRLYDIAIFLQEHGFNSVEFLPLRLLGQAEGHEEISSDAALYIKSFMEIINAVEDGKINRLKVRSILRMLMPLLTGQTIHGELGCRRCGAGRNSIAINYDGSITGCDMIPDKISPVIGNVWDGINNIAELDKLIFPVKPHSINSSCSKCTWFGFCRSGCPGASASDYGSCNTRHLFTCALNKSIYPYLLERIVKGNGKLQEYFKRHTKLEKSNHEDS
ncbi:MAG: radical SAM protein [Synergistaceae bacterium]|nr:radical SAM protein [Synergistaceae bacterium]